MKAATGKHVLMLQRDYSRDFGNCTGDEEVEFHLLYSMILSASASTSA
jgi:hypothetical protein